MELLVHQDTIVRKGRSLVLSTDALTVLIEQLKELNVKIALMFQLVLHALSPPHVLLVHLVDIATILSYLEVVPV